MVEQLKEFISNNNLHSKAIDRFWAMIKLWQKDHPEEYAKSFRNTPVEGLDIFIHEIGMRVYDWPNCNSNLVRVTIYASRFGRGGFSYYSCYFSLTGEYVSDSWNA